MVYFKVIGFIKVVPLGRVICFNFIILCNRSFCNSLSEVLEFRRISFVLLSSMRFQVGMD